MKLPGIDVTTYVTLAEVVTAGHDKVMKRFATIEVALTGTSGSPSGITTLEAVTLEDPKAFVATTVTV
ncbi:unannotated protein [freshwater metagenome]|uniref:Unannotated protein n=1 Tax=freshwater metagenome TaxID=449393 RepID=A0A6J6H4J4_9ZZZZ